MTPSMWGRIQTRLLLAVAVGIPITMLIGAMSRLSIPDGLGTLAAVTVLGLGWDLDYDALQRTRRDRDWPSLFALLSVIPEGLVGWPVIRFLGLTPGPGLYALQLAVVWLAGFLATQGPLRIVAPYARVDGGRLLPHQSRPVSSITGFAPEPIRSARLAHARPRLGRPQLAGFAFLGLAAVVALAMVVLGRGPHRELTTTAPSAHQAAVPPTRPAPTSRPAQVLVNRWDTMSRVTPIRLLVPSGALSVQPVGLNSQRVLSAPADSSAIGWYAASPAPGQVGSSVLAGTASGNSGALARLSNVRTGSSLVVQRSDGSAVVFTVTRVLASGATDFPTREVYAPSRVPSLRVIGADGSGGNVRNVIVFATAIGLVPGHA